MRMRLVLKVEPPPDGPIEFPPAGGTYVLMLHLGIPSQVRVGQFCTASLAPGFYLYAGSAFVRGGLKARLEHHIAGKAKPHWHVDYLRRHAKPVEVWFTTSKHHLEHTFAAVLRVLPGTTLAVAGFGATDCECESHLYFIINRPTITEFRKRLWRVSRLSIDLHARRLQ